MYTIKGETLFLGVLQNKSAEIIWSEYIDSK